MDIKTLCLGLLSSGEACGYELKKEFESLFKHFYPAGYGSIYPALADLAESGLVSCRELAQDGKPDRKIYSITEKGRIAFTEALHHATPHHKLRSEFLVMVYFADLMGPERVGHMLDKWADDLRDALAHINQIERDLGTDMPAGTRFVAGFGSAVTQSAAAYIESNRHLLCGNETSSDDSETNPGNKTPIIETRV